MSETESVIHRQQDLYWKELVQLKVRCEYMRRYRSLLARWVTRFAALRAVASSGSIAGWVVWRELAFIWAAMIAAAQVADALKDVFPVTFQHQVAAELTMNLEALLIEALFEWEGVFAGIFTDVEIMERRRRLMERQHDADIKHFPKGNLAERQDLLRLAKSDAATYFDAMFGVEG
jgi:hypothetical protein